MQKLHTFFSGKNINIYAIFNDQSFNDTLTNDIDSFQQMGPGVDFFLVGLASFGQVAVISNAYTLSKSENLVSMKTRSNCSKGQIIIVVSTNKGR